MLTARTVVLYACHCLECQKQSASAFALSAPGRLADLAVHGSPVAYEQPADGGSRTTCWFCPECGTRIYHQSSRATDRVTLKAGRLDNTRGLVQVAHLWVGRKQSWLKLSADVPAYETRPDDLAGWRDALIAPAESR
ncbi:MAG: GFA family protein [Hyphomicrobiales bacterium]